METSYNKEYEEDYKVEHLENQDTQEEEHAEDELSSEPEPQPQKGEYWYIIDGQIYFYEYEQDNGLKAIPDQQMRQILKAMNDAPKNHKFKLYDNGSYEYTPPTLEEEKEGYIKAESEWAGNEWELIKEQLMFEMVLDMPPLAPMADTETLKDYGKAIINYLNHLKYINIDDGDTNYKVDRPAINNTDLKSILNALEVKQCKRF